MFEVGRVYDRRREIHEPYGGQWQGGISTPRGWPLVLLFTAQTGKQHGYEDGWDENGVLLYTGEGQVGDQHFTHGNRSIRDHARDGKGLHLFESLGKGKGYRYLGLFACSTWEYRRGWTRRGTRGGSSCSTPFDQGKRRRSEKRLHPPLPLNPSIDFVGVPLRRPRPQSRGPERGAKRFFYERSAAVREYVLARAGGVCESCGKQAPFRKPDGAPYLEPHRTRRISDGGPDDPRWVAAICPNCHREIHHGEHGEEKNRRLQQHLAVLEGR